MSNLSWNEWLAQAKPGDEVPEEFWYKIPIFDNRDHFEKAKELNILAIVDDGPNDWMEWVEHLESKE
jgi:hypothetical protein